jgi:uncharacterized protein (TIGR03437 family)
MVLGCFMPKMSLERVFLGALLGASSLSAQTTCVNVQLQLTSDYSFAIGSSSGGSAYALTLGGKPLAQGSLTQLALFHYDSSLASTSGIAPLKSVGTSFVPGKWGSAVAIATGGNLSYPASGNISFTDGTIELWIAPTKDGTDPIYSKYDHTLFRYTAANGDQLVLSESASGGSFYAGTSVGGTFTGTGGVQMASLKAGAWHHVAFTYSRASQRLRLYLDGLLVNERDVAFSMPASGGNSFTVDSDPYGNASAFLVDDMRISSSEETAAQIQYNATRSTPFADNEVLVPLAGVSPGQLNYSVTGCGSTGHSWPGIPITNVNPPSNLLAPGTSALTLSFNTLQPSSCAYSVGTQAPFSAMHAFATGQKTTSHQGDIAGISSNPQVLNTVYVQCDSNPDFTETLQYRVVGSRSGAYPRIGDIWIGNYLVNTSPSVANKVQLYLGPGNLTPSEAIALRAKDPNVLILPSVNATETTGGNPVVPSDYLLRDVNGNAIEDWPGNFLLNLTKPEVAAFLAKYAYQQYFVNANFAYDGLFWDNFHITLSNAIYDYRGVLHQVDANGDGIQDNQTTLNAVWGQGVYALIAAFNALTPNAYSSGHIGQSPPSLSVLQAFQGDAFTFDAVRVREGAASFESLLASYNAWFDGGRQPAIATIQSSPPTQIAYGYGYNQLQNMLPATVQFGQTYYPNMRFGLATALMNDGFSIYDFGDIAQNVTWWYDEYDFDLGSPLAKAALAGSNTPSANLLLNGSFEAALTNGWQFSVNKTNGESATLDQSTFVVAEGNYSAHVAVTALSTGAPAPTNVQFYQPGISLVSGNSYTLSFWARSSSARNMTLNIVQNGGTFGSYGLSGSASLGSNWQQYTFSFTANTTASDGRLDFYFGEQTGDAWIDGVAIQLRPPSIYRRDYSNGSVIVNGTASRQTIPIEAGFQKFSGNQAPLWQYILDDVSPGFSADSSWQTVTYDTGLTDYGFNGKPGSSTAPFYHAWNSTAHLQSAAGSAAQWGLNIPRDGQYTIQVWLPNAPSAKTWTNSAVYEVVSNGAVIATATLDQTIGAAGDAWHMIATVNLTTAGAPFLRVHNGGTGPLLADAVYVASSAPFNDGSAVSQVTLGPFDGILLQRANPVPLPTSQVNSVVNAASYQGAITSAGFVSIVGTGFGTTTRGWSSSDFTGTNLPTSLSGVSVTINGKPAYVEYVSPTQVNVIAPDDDTIGPVPVQVTASQGASYTGTVLKQRVSPAFFTYVSGTTIYAVAVHSDGSLVGPAGPSSRPAVPGEVIEIYGTGFGTTDPAMPTSQLVSQPAPLPLPATVSIGGLNAAVQWVGLVSSGLYQLNVTVPMVTTGDQTVQTTVSGFQSPSGVFLPVSSN